MKRGSKEHGQIMILLALAIIVLLGFTALAVDMGMAYADRRQAQNAADAAALAGAQNAGTWIKANKGSCNGFGAAQKSAAQSAAAVAAGKFYSSVTPTVDVSDCQNGQVGVTVSLSHTVRGAVFQRDSTNTVQAAAGVKSGGIADGFGLVTLGDNCDSDQMYFDGNSSVDITSGGVFSNGGFVEHGNGKDLHVNSVKNEFWSSCKAEDKHGVFDPAAQPANYQVSVGKIPGLSEACDTLKVKNLNPEPIASGKGTSYDYGYYTKGLAASKGKNIYLNPGLYCIEGGINLEGNNTMSSSGGVTLYFLSGGMDLSGNNGNGNKNASKVTLEAPTDTTNYGIPGLVIYFDDLNPSTLDLRGTADSVIRGTILVPKGSVELGGNSTLSEPVDGQVIAYKLKVHGTAELKINYNQGTTYKGSETLDMLR